MYIWCMCVHADVLKGKRERERESQSQTHLQYHLFSSHQLCCSRDEIILEGDPLIGDQFKPQEPPADALETSQRQHVHVCTCVWV